MNVISRKDQESLRDAFLSGKSYRLAGVHVGVSPVTAIRYYRIFKAEGLRQPEFCQCGDRLGHRGWCRYRFLQSGKRQRYMKQFGHFHGTVKEGEYDKPKHIRKRKRLRILFEQKFLDNFFQRIVKQKHSVEVGPTNEQLKLMEEYRQWHEGKKTLRQVRKLLNNPNP